jgi:hypothetical protein
MKALPLTDSILRADAALEEARKGLATMADRQPRGKMVIEIAR